jgi:hypothetical protein
VGNNGLFRQSQREGFDYTAGRGIGEEKGGYEGVCFGIFKKSCSKGQELTIDCPFCALDKWFPWCYYAIMEFKLDTRKHRHIGNKQDTGSLPESYLRDNDKFMGKYPLATFRTSPSGLYNCHGLTFASKRTRIPDNSEIVKIIDDDNYFEITVLSNVFPGDIIIYIDSDGERFHSGIVIDVCNNGGLMGIRVLSKWGYGSEVCHPHTYCPYYEMAAKIKFYRITR